MISRRVGLRCIRSSRGGSVVVVGRECLRWRGMCGMGDLFF